ncbi:MAG: TIGR04283 family arsenosugar biosynthesis glycosyltransferase [Gammaproteobacteria bacterium]|nr:TIGR04283 family arsenosugar biosynthesis glycosyltransferase [Gammaproteobacteria bacterium]
MKQTKISFIIPTLNEAEHISLTLDRLQVSRQRGHEVILSDGASHDNTLLLSKDKIDDHINSTPGRAVQMNAGAKIASGDILCFLHADTKTPENIDELILESLTARNKQSFHWGFFNIKLSGRDWPFRIIEWLINKRSCLSHVATGDQAIFIDKHSFKKINGFSNIPLMEDIEISKRLRKTSRPVCIKKSPLITSSRRWEKHGITSTVLLMWQLRLRYFLGASPATLAKTYKPHKQITSPNKQQLIVFIKAPIPGFCKTRLTPYLSPEEASDFYESLVKNCFNKITAIKNTDISIYTYPDINHPFIKKISQQYSTTCHLQSGENLGERMFNALNESLKTYDKSILIGTDCPLLDQSYLEQAFKALEQDDIVLGPADDGGYVLVGASKIEAQLFNNINWGTDSVLKQSLHNANKAAYKTHLLDTLWDVDTPQDYIKYQNLIQQPTIQATSTARET